MKALIERRVVWSILLLCFGVGNPELTHAQTHLKGQRFFQVSAQAVDRPQLQLPAANAGYGVSLQLGRYNKHLNSFLMTFGYARKHYPLALVGDSTLIPLEQFSFSYGYQFNFYRSANRLFFVRGTTQAMAGYESVNKSQYRLGKDYGLAGRSRFLIGVDGSVEIEWANVTVGICQRWNPTSRIQPFHTFYQLGYRFHL